MSIESQTHPELGGKQVVQIGILVTFILGIVLLFSQYTIAGVGMILLMSGFFTVHSFYVGDDMGAFIGAGWFAFAIFYMLIVYF